VFGRYALPTSIPAELTLFGYPSGVILTNLVIVAIVGAIVFLSYVSTVVQDTAFPTAHPWLFIVGFVPASVIYVITDFRSGRTPNVTQALLCRAGFRDNGRINFTGLNLDFLFLTFQSWN
jgi:hypothetical protein